MLTTITHRQRMEACVSGHPTDRIPVALWRHFPVDDQTADGLARATLNYQHNFDFDLVKITPASSFCLKDWGVQDEWHGSSEGTRDYTQRIIHDPEDWLKLPVLDPGKGHLGAQLNCLQIIHSQLGSRTPVLQTIFNPLSQAKNLAGGERLLVHLRLYPEAVHAGLKIITHSIQRFIEAVTRIGIDGIFYAIQHAQYGLLSPQEYLTFGKTYDLEVLKLEPSLWLNMVHLHGNQVMFNEILDYPVQVINWHDRETWPSLSEAQNLTPKVLCGGLQREKTMLFGTPQHVRTEAIEACRATDGQRFILGTGCVTPITAPYGNLITTRQCIEEIV